jgi:hypothetical protein
MAGCNAIENQHKEWSIVNNKRVLLKSNTTRYGSACVNIKTGVMIAEVKNEFLVIVFSRELLDSPESMKVILNGLANFWTGGMSKVADNLTD